jgi:hypothetical protein
MNNEDYLNLFKKIQEQEDEDQNPELKSLNETPNFEEYGNPEVKNFSQYQNLNEVQITPDINESVNDAWSQNIEIETRVNGQVVKRGNANPDPYVQRKAANKGNGLDQYLQEDNLNEVIRNKQNVNTNLTNVQNEVKNEHDNNIDTRALNESSLTYKDVDVITAEMWYNWSQASIYPLALNLKQL